MATYTYSIVLLRGGRGIHLQRVHREDFQQREFNLWDGSRGKEPGQDVLASDLAKSSLQTKEVMPVQDQALAPQGSKGSAPDRE
jgi:hypothetical protein